MKPHTLKMVLGFGAFLVCAVLLGLENVLAYDPMTRIALIGIMGGGVVAGGHGALYSKPPNEPPQQ